MKVLKLYLWAGGVLLLGLYACSSSTEEVLYEVAFDKVEDLQWVRPETEGEELQVSIQNQALDIDAINGATVWFTEKLTAPIVIEYTAVVVDEGGPNDRVSDLNCFWMAIDPRCPADIFSCADSIRTGNFGTYHALRTYYVGYGGNENKTTRLRRYPGYTRERPMLPEHDLGEPHVLKANQEIRVRISVTGNQVRYAHDGEVVLELDDALPYHEGWFAFRTVRNHMRIKNLRISRPAL